jgi:AcrR family transcriptional regulator
VERGLELTREAGPTALSLRETTRLEGVSPTAAYRHFARRSDLLRAVAREIQERMAQRMRRRMRASADASAVDRARLRLRGVGLGYVAFAVAEPGWFETAFFGDTREVGPGSDDCHVPAPFALLVGALDDLVEVGWLSAERRAGAEYACWSAVHGCAELMLHGPLRAADAAMRRSVTERVVDDIIAGVR